MKTATIKEIDSGIFFSHDHFIKYQGVDCSLVAIHGRDKSTEEAYKGVNNSTLVTLKPLSGGKQRKVMLDNSTEFKIVEIKKKN